MDAAVWGLIGTLVGALASIATTFIAGQHAFSLQRRTSLFERLEKHRAFQHDTLIELQDAVHEALRMVSSGYFEDLKAFQTSGQWGSALLSDEVNQGILTANRRVVILVQRVADDALRAELQAVYAAVNSVSLAKSRVECEGLLQRATTSVMSVMEHVGRVLRGLYQVSEP
jgi:hypothetical protein